MKTYSLSHLDDELRRLIPDYDSEPVAHVEEDAEPSLLPDGISENDIRRYLEAPHSKGTRSETFHRAVWMLHDSGRSKTEIADILKDLPWLPSRFKKRLSAEIDRSLSKPRPVCCAAISPSDAPQPLNKIKSVSLESCPQLCDAFLHMLEQHGIFSGISLSDKIKDTCRAIEGVSQTTTQSVVMLHCGLGKSTWAVVQIGTYASRNNQYVLVLQNRESVFHAVQQLRNLMSADDIGIYVGWNSEECVALSGQKHEFKDCLRDDPESACPACRGRANCHYHRSRSQLRRAAVVMTLESFLVLCEKKWNFRKSNIICDEALLTFADMDFTAEELDTLYRIFTRYGYDRKLSGLLKSLFPSLSFNAFSGVARIPVQHIRWYALSKVWDTDIIRRVIRFVKAAGARLGESEALVFRFLLFFRTAAECGAHYAYSFDGRVLRVKKDRLDLRTFTACRSIMVLDATAALSLSEFAPSTCIYTCPDLDRYARQGAARVFVAVGNPTKRRRVLNIEAGLGLMQLHGAEIFGGGSEIMLVFNNDAEAAMSQIESCISYYAQCQGKSAGIRKIGRGRLRGTNELRMCTSAFLTATGFFTSIEDCALHACLRKRRDIPWSEIRNSDGSPRMHHGRFTNDVVQDIYMRKAITELYQGIYRTAIRDGRDVSIVLSVPDVGWLVPLWQLMRFTVVDATHCNPQTVQMFTGLSQLVNMDPGKVVGKCDAAAYLGYTSADAWKDHKAELTGLLGQFFMIKHHNLIRKEVA